MEESGPVSVDKWQEIVVEATKKVCALTSNRPDWYAGAEAELDQISAQRNNWKAKEIQGIPGAKDQLRLHERRLRDATNVAIRKWYHARAEEMRQMNIDPKMP